MVAWVIIERLYFFKNDLRSERRCRRHNLNSSERSHPNTGKPHKSGRWSFPDRWSDISLKSGRQNIDDFETHSAVLLSFREEGTNLYRKLYNHLYSIVNIRYYDSGLNEVKVYRSSIWKCSRPLGLFTLGAALCLWRRWSLIFARAEYTPKLEALRCERMVL
jgi:hypothetical protein